MNTQSLFPMQHVAVQASARRLKRPFCMVQFSGEFRRACDAQLRQLHTALKGCAGTTQPISNFSVFVRVPSSFDAGDLCLQRVAFRAGDDSAGEPHMYRSMLGQKTPSSMILSHRHPQIRLIIAQASAGLMRACRRCS
jgi:hypothetical protein